MVGILHHAEIIHVLESIHTRKNALQVNCYISVSTCNKVVVKTRCCQCQLSTITSCSQRLYVFFNVRYRIIQYSNRHLLNLLECKRNNSLKSISCFHCQQIRDVFCHNLYLLVPYQGKECTFNEAFNSVRGI